MRSLHGKCHWMSAVDPLYLMCCLVSVCINECSHLSVSGELERKPVCVCFTVTCILVCVCVCVNKPLFVCGFGWRPLPLLLSEYGQVAVYVWMWHLCAVILLCGLPMLHWSKRLSLHHWHTLPWSWSHPHFLLFFNHPFCQLPLRFSASSKQYVKRVCLN